MSELCSNEEIGAVVRPIALRFGREYNADNPSAMAQDITEHLAAALAEPCCPNHAPRGCCDPVDCGPCCRNCPTCPKLAGEEGITADLGILADSQRGTYDSDAAYERVLAEVTRLRTDRDWWAENARRAIWQEGELSREVSQLRAKAEKLRELRGCLGAGPMDYEAFVDEFDRITDFPAAEPLGSTPSPTVTMNVDDFFAELGSTEDPPAEGRSE